LTIACPSVFHKNQISERYLGQIAAVAEKALKKKCEIKLAVKQRAVKQKKGRRGSGEGEDLFSVDIAKMEREAYLEAAARVGLSAALTFKNFAVSGSNEVAHAAARTAAKSPGQVAGWGWAKPT